jgi:hypothetical protein
MFKLITLTMICDRLYTNPTEINRNCKRIHPYPHKKKGACFPLLMNDNLFLDFKLSPCFICNMFSFGCFPGVWLLISDVPEPSIGSIFLGSSMQIYYILLPKKIKLIEGSETSAISIQTPGKHPKENILHIKHGESFKSRMSTYTFANCIEMCLWLTKSLNYTPWNERKSHYHESVRFPIDIYLALKHFQLQEQITYIYVK